MKRLTDYIFESQLSDKVFCEQFSIMFKNTKITKDILKQILNNLSLDFVKKLSKYFSTEDITNYVSYEPSDDLFINYNSNKDKIINQIADYMLKTRV